MYVYYIDNGNLIRITIIIILYGMTWGGDKQTDCSHVTDHWYLTESQSKLAIYKTTILQIKKYQCFCFLTSLSHDYVHL